jgi:hypothetical protein
MPSFFHHPSLLTCNKDEITVDMVMDSTYVFLTTPLQLTLKANLSQSGQFVQDSMGPG